MTRLPIAALLPVLVAACSSDLELRYHGRKQLSDGAYEVHGSLAHDAQQWALVSEFDADDALSLLPFDGQPGCALPAQVARIFAVGTGLGLRLGIYDRRQRPRGLRFIDADCEPHLEPLDATLEVSFRGGGFLVRSADRSLRWLDPWNDRSHTLSQSADGLGIFVVRPGSAGYGAEGLWVLEGDALLLRDFAGKEIERVGEGVREFAMAADRSEMIFGDSLGVHRLRSDGSAPETLAGPGCELSYERANNDGYVAAFYAPCDERRLRVVMPPDDRVVEIDQGVQWHFRHHDIQLSGATHTWTFYETRSVENGIEQIGHHLLWSDLETRTELDVALGPDSFATPIDTSEPPGRWLLSSGETPPRLGAWSAETGFVEITDDFRALLWSPMGPLVFHHLDDGGVGQLELLERGQLVSLAAGVPSEGLLGLPTPADVERLPGLIVIDAVIHDYDGEVGTLSRITRDSGLEELARGVPPAKIDRYATYLRGAELVDRLQTATILAYLENFDPSAGSGRLSALLEHGAPAVIDEGVGSYVSSSDVGIAGLLYAIPSGNRQGLWFARQ
ncbi:MAG: hypothetical protein OEZ06_10240 [Myxococcales bacterium]|nr:hypothetical protein [Myxococcales bacterium]